MTKYFRTLFYLICFFLEDDFAFVDYPKDDAYYAIIHVARQILKKHFREPFKSVRTIYIDSAYASAFQDRILIRYNKNCILEEVMPKALNDWLWKFFLVVKGIDYNDSVISSFSYSYL